MPPSYSGRRALDPRYKANRPTMAQRRQQAVEAFWRSEDGWPARWECCPPAPPIRVAETFYATTEGLEACWHLDPDLCRTA